MSAAWHIALLCLADVAIMAAVAYVAYGLGGRNELRKMIRAKRALKPLRRLGPSQFYEWCRATGNTASSADSLAIWHDLCCERGYELDYEGLTGFYVKPEPPPTRD